MPGTGQDSDEMSYWGRQWAVTPGFDDNDDVNDDDGDDDYEYNSDNDDDGDDKDNADSNIKHDLFHSIYLRTILCRIFLSNLA